MSFHPYGGPSCCPTSEFHHVQSFRGPIRPLMSQAKPKLSILDFKITWRGNGILFGATSV